MRLHASHEVHASLPAGHLLLAYNGCFLRSQPDKFLHAMLDLILRSNSDMRQAMSLKSPGGQADKMQPLRAEWGQLQPASSPSTLKLEANID